MIQTKIHLEKTSYLFKTLKKRGFLEEYNDTLFIWLNHKPSIGELILVDAYSVRKDDEKLKNYLQNRNNNIILRIDDLCYNYMNLKTEKEGIDVLNLKCHVDSTINWI